MIENIIIWLVIGLVVGVLGRLILPGRASVGWVPTIGIGIVAALVGGWLSYRVLHVDDSDYRPFGFEGDGWIAWVPMIISVVLAAVGISLYAGSAGRGHRRARR
ncbi:GlsB/YeaQ/YmgE family stress response membrane protein [Luteipulveratus sp. YIM 133132]|uniref:GlsB/YeaQ/YmgE family stress response membrane protein n=1 Tax=Luteipulveratus flavus TaxID=3031728 RepID=A0ABT6CBH5_9MICO|nr:MULTISPECIES: GlsB/YeaQ/YmgE family stress response membrane protein [unclassified Luteipulveratus]MDE9365608.1 GlsB/YeaQ/YmgE family stress response membrane protein [Luteipulveratus sp. YIM 133132]MDF8265727.1 GlsB/YeaQ/YmgE family stress response membrane protein [Luteipulveratus sp. YIM 133296]